MVAGDGWTLSIVKSKIKNCLLSAKQLVRTHQFHHAHDISLLHLVLVVEKHRMHLGSTTRCTSSFVNGRVAVRGLIGHLILLKHTLGFTSQFDNKVFQ